MKLFWTLLFFAFNTTSCQQLCSEKNTMAAIHDYSNILKKEKGIVCGMYGLEYAGPDKIYDGKIHLIALGYDTNKRMKYEEARSFFYEIADGLLAHLNKNEKIRSYFFHTPLTYADLELHLTFDFEHSDSLKRDEVESIHINNNKISYYIVDKEAPKKTTNGKEAPHEYFRDYFTKHRCITHKLPEKIGKSS